MLLLGLGGLLASPVILPTSAHARNAAEDDEEFLADTAWVKFKLVHDGKTHAHPGYLASAQEEMIQSMGPHEVSIVVDRSDAGQWSAKVKYSVNGKLIASGEQNIRTKKWVTFKSADGKSKVQVHLDPNATDSGDDITLGKGRQPLDGLK